MSSSSSSSSCMARLLACLHEPARRARTLIKRIETRRPWVIHFYAEEPSQQEHQRPPSHTRARPEERVQPQLPRFPALLEQPRLEHTAPSRPVAAVVRLCRRVTAVARVDALDLQLLYPRHGPRAVDLVGRGRQHAVVAHGGRALGLDERAVALHGPPLAPLHLLHLLLLLAERRHPGAVLALELRCCLRVARASDRSRDVEAVWRAKNARVSTSSSHPPAARKSHAPLSDASLSLSFSSCTASCTLLPPALPCCNTVSRGGTRRHIRTQADRTFLTLGGGDDERSGERASRGDASTCSRGRSSATRQTPASSAVSMLQLLYLFLYRRQQLSSRRRWRVDHVCDHHTRPASMSFSASSSPSILHPPLAPSNTSELSSFH